MNQALLYKPNSTWQIWIAFAGAVLLHLGAIAFAQRDEQVTLTAGVVEKPRELVTVLVEQPPTVPEVDPVEPDVPPPPPLDDTFIPEENATPPPIITKPALRPPTPIDRPRTSQGSTAMGDAKVLAITAPRPEYPYEARRQRATGSGVALLIVDPRTGSVTDVQMSRSTGNAVLDNAAVNAFRRWRFKAGTVTAVRTPITFTLTGATF